MGKGRRNHCAGHTYAATWHARRPDGRLFYDRLEPDLVTFNIDPRQIEQHITSRTKAILPVHLYGQACNMTAIMTWPKNTI